MIKTTLQLKVMDEVSAAYVAGLFEGEGCVQGKGHNWIMSIGMTDKEPLALVKTLLGGTLQGPYTTSNTRKPVYRWTICNRIGVEFSYNQIKKWLSPRRIEQFEKVLSFKSKAYPTSLECGLSDPNVPSQYGYVRHMRHKESPCASCRSAHTLYMAWYRKHGRERPRKSLTDAQIELLWQRIAAGTSHRTIAKELGVSRKTVDRVVRQITYKRGG